MTSFNRETVQNINFTKLTSVTIDGAQAMIGKKKGLIGLPRRDPETPDFFSNHCNLHERWRAHSENSLCDDHSYRNFILANALKQ